MNFMVRMLCGEKIQREEVVSVVGSPFVTVDGLVEQGDLDLEVSGDEEWASVSIMQLYLWARSSVEA